MSSYMPAPESNEVEPPTPARLVLAKPAALVGIVAIMIVAGSFSMIAFLLLIRDLIDFSRPFLREIGTRVRAWKARAAGIDAGLPTLSYQRPPPPPRPPPPSPAESSTDAGDDVECTVCLSPIRDGQMVRLLPGCDHVFHVMCIDAWLRMQARGTCPVCRASVKSDQP